MSSFTEDVELKISSRRNNFAKTTKEFHWYISDISKIIVPVGFVTDGLSVPWILSWMFSRYGIYLKAALVHDRIYAERTFGRQYADELFYDMLLVLGCPKWKALFAYYSLWAFGWIAWNRHRKGKNNEQ